MGRGVRLPVFLASLIAVLTGVLAGPALAEEDPRTAIFLPNEVETRFLAEMRTHLAHLDDIVAALAEDDFKQAARIADLHMTRGHHRWAKMAEAGASDEDIAAAKARFKERHAAGSGQAGSGMGMGMGGGFGRYMPEDFRAMGAVFHDAAESFAETTRTVATPVSAEDYRAVLAGLQEVTTACRGCHDAFRIEAAQ